MRAFVLLLLVSVACSSSGAGRSPDADAAPDVAIEVAADVPEEPSGIPIPWTAPPLAKPGVDEPYPQEFNHTSIPGSDPLVAVVAPPPGWEATFGTPIPVTATGPIAPPEGTWIAAAASGDRIALATAGRVVFPRQDGTIEGEATSPSFAIAGIEPLGAGRFLLLTAGGVATVEAGPGSVPAAVTAPLATAATFAKGATILAGTDFVRAPTWDLAIPPGKGLGKVVALVADVTLPEPIDLVVVGEQGLAGIRVTGASAAFADVPAFAPDRVPLRANRSAARTPDGGFVVAGAGGAMRFMEREGLGEWRVYNATRWLPSEDVRDVAVEPADLGRIWLATAGGLATVEAKRMTIEDKLVAFVDRIVERHDREGAVADSHLTVPGDLSSNVPWDSDNDGSWTSYWLVAECWRWKVTGAADAKTHFDKSLDAMLRLRTLTGTDHFLARAVIRKSTCTLDDCNDPDDGHWYTSPVDPDFWVKRDTSNDEVIAHVFMMGPAYDLCADEVQKQRIREHVAGIIGGIVDHGYKLIDPITNLETTYGQWNPEYIDMNPSGYFGDGGLRALEILAGLTLAHHLTGEARFAEAKAALIRDHQYDDKARDESQRPSMPGHSDNDEMATYGFFTLMRYETDPALRTKWLDGWKLLWKHLSVQQGAWWDLVNVAVGGEQPDTSRALRWLRRAPVDMIRWDQHNSHRHDLVAAPAPYRKHGSMRSDGHILPYDERRCDRWNTSQFMVDGGMGAAVEMDGADVLAPYWMARYHGWIVPAEEHRRGLHLPVPLHDQRQPHHDSTRSSNNGSCSNVSSDSGSGDNWFIRSSSPAV